MKIVKLQGGLGNQMFQYAFARALYAATGELVYGDRSGLDGRPEHNVYELERVFGINFAEPPSGAVESLAYPAKGLLNRFLRKYLTKASHIIDRKFCYQPDLMTLPGDRYYEGYWQTEKYSLQIAQELRNAFAFREALDERNLAALASLPRPVASVHVRRGDYLAHPNLNICGSAYYERAAKAAAQDGTAAFLVFSDDVDYCRKNLSLGNLPVAYVDWNRGMEAWRDMALMARCDAHVIANSSFSWWGAWLDPAPDKSVFAPLIWNRREIEDKDHYYSYGFGDVIPEAWRRIPV